MTPVNVYDLGLIYDVSANSPGLVSIRMTPTAPNCPAAEKLLDGVETAVQSVDGVTAVDLELVFDPPWSKERMSADSKLALGLEGSIPAEGLFGVR